MSDIRKQENIERLRKELYARDVEPARPQHFEQPRSERPQVTESWQQPPQPKEPEPAIFKTYRKRILLVGVLFFFISLLASSAFFFFGQKGISGDNITLSLSGPFTIGAGDTLPLQVAIQNQNPVAIESATLIVQYPSGTKRADGSFADVSVERIPVESIASGQTQNIPLRAIVFGKEDSEHMVTASIEYRVAGSNSTFEKDAQSLRYKISSIPVSVSVAANKKVSSGQPETITLTLRSNAQNPIKNLLVNAEYPTGFTFVSSTPAPYADNDVWLIEELAPEGEAKIVIKSKIFGQESDTLVTHFTVGVPESDDYTRMAAVFGEASNEFLIENPFLGMKIDLGGGDDSAVVSKGRDASGFVEVTNSMNTAIYDVAVTLDLSGNALGRPAVKMTDGLFNEQKNTITWDGSNKRELESLAPGQRVRLSFSLPVNSDVPSAPYIALKANATARRVSDASAAESLQATAEGTVRVLAETQLLADARLVQGPVPPKVGQETQYKITMRTQNGSNDIENAVVKTSLPSHVRMVEVVGGGSSVNYNENNRNLTWNIGNVTAGGAETISFIVAITPTSAQVGQTLGLVNSQYLTATDSFTKKPVDEQHGSVTSELSTELGFSYENGRVVQ